MAEDKKREKNKANSDDKKRIQAGKKQTEVLGGIGKSGERQSKLSDINNRISKAQLDATTLRSQGATKEADLITSGLSDISELLSRNTNTNALNNRDEDLSALEEVTAKVIKQVADKNADNVLTREFKDLTESLKRDKAVLETLTFTGRSNLQKQITKLSRSASTAEEKSFAQSLGESFTKVNKNLKDAIESGDQTKIDVAEKQVRAFNDTVISEEERREQQKKSEDSNSRLKAIQQASEGFNKNLKSLAKGGGFVAGLAAITLAVFSPETLSKVVNKFIGWFQAIADTLENLINGDMEALKKDFEDNLGLFGGLIGMVAVYFGPTLIAPLIRMLSIVKFVKNFMLFTAIPALATFFGTLATAMGTMVTKLGVLRTFILATAIPAVTAFVTGALATLSTLLVPLLPFIAVGAAIAAGIGLLTFGFLKLKGSLGEGATVMDTLKVAALYFVDFLSMIVNGLTFIPRKMVSFLGKRAAGWILGDDFDTSALDAIGEGLDTGRGRRAADEIRAKNEKAAAEAALEKERQSKINTTGTGDIMTTFESDTSNILADLQATGFKMPEGMTNNISNVITNNNSDSVSISSNGLSRIEQELAHLGFSR